MLRVPRERAWSCNVAMPPKRRDGPLGRSAHRQSLRLEVEYEPLVTNRLILQPLIEPAIYGKSDPEYGLGAGLTSVETGLRLRNETRRELAPYVGVTWGRKYFGTAGFARAAGEDLGGARLVFGLRTWS